MMERLSRRIITVAMFALAMARVESAVVYYLRTMIERIEQTFNILFRIDFIWS